MAEFTSRDSRLDARLSREDAKKSSNHDVDLHNLEMQMQTDVQSAQGGGASEIGQQRMENAWLRRRVVELDQQLNVGAGEDVWLERQREYEALLEEKSEVIRMLHHKIQELQQGGGAGHSSAKSQRQAPGEDELLEAKRQLDEERQQLREDEEALMAQMRQMEITMSKERAELARQRNDLQRMHEELNREIEMAARDGSLRDRLVALQRRQQEAIHKPGPAPAGSPAPQKPGAVPPDQRTPLPGGGAERKQSSGLLRRLFG